MTPGRGHRATIDSHAPVTRAPALRAAAGGGFAALRLGGRSVAAPTVIDAAQPGLAFAGGCLAARCSG